MRHLHVGSKNASILPKGWREGILAHTYRKNKDGSISVVVLVNIYGKDKEVYSTERTRLRKSK